MTLSMSKHISSKSLSHRRRNHSTVSLIFICAKQKSTFTTEIISMLQQFTPNFPSHKDFFRITLCIQYSCIDSKGYHSESHDSVSVTAIKIRMCSSLNYINTIYILKNGKIQVCHFLYWREC